MLKVSIDGVEHIPSDAVPIQFPKEFVVPDWVILALINQYTLEKEYESFS